MACPKLIQIKIFRNTANYRAYTTLLSHQTYLSELSTFLHLLSHATARTILEIKSRRLKPCCLGSAHTAIMAAHSVMLSSSLSFITIVSLTFIFLILFTSIHFLEIVAHTHVHAIFR